MESTLILIIIVVILLVLVYYILVGLVSLLKQLADHSRGALKSIFIIAGVISLIWIGVNHQQSEVILNHLRYWASDIRNVNLFDINWE